MLRLRLLGIFTLLVTITFSLDINAQGRRKSPVRGNRQTENAFTVTYQSNNPYVVMLVREHAKLVGRFIHHGHQ